MYSLTTEIRREKSFDKQLYRCTYITECESYGVGHCLKITVYLYEVCRISWVVWGS